MPAFLMSGGPRIKVLQGALHNYLKEDSSPKELIYNDKTLSEPQRANLLRKARELDELLDLAPKGPRTTGKSQEPPVSTIQAIRNFFFPKGR
jgi:hypothetical protein